MPPSPAHPSPDSGQSPASQRDDRRDRERRILLTSGAAATAKAVSMVANLALVPILLGHLGAETYGAWVTGLSLVGWFGLINLGVVPGLVNELSRRSGRFEDASDRELISTAFWLQAALALAVSLVAWVGLSRLPLEALFRDADPAVLRAAAPLILAIVVAVVVNLPLSVASGVLMARQLGHMTQVGRAAGSALVVIGALVATALDGPIWLLAGIVASPSVVKSLVEWLFLLKRQRFVWPRLVAFRRAHARALIAVGWQFLLVALAGAVILSTDNIVISAVLGAEHVTPYSVAFTLTQVVIAFVMMVLNASWPAYSEAAAQRDLAWIRKTHRRITRVTWALLGASAVGLAALGMTVIRLWAGDEAVPTYPLLLSLILLATIQGLFLPLGRLVTALGRVGVTAAVGVTNAAINLVASLILVHVLGTVGVALGTCIGYAATGWVLIPVARGSLKRMQANG